MSSTVEETGGYGSNSVSDSLPQTQEDTTQPPNAPAAPRPPRPRKAMKRRSKIWDHFEKLVDQDGVESAKCNYCAKVFSSNTKNGTSSLHHHMNSCSENPHNKETRQALLNFQKSANDEDNVGMGTLNT